MNIKYIVTQHSISEKADDDTAPLLGIMLFDVDNMQKRQEYGMSKQLKEFSLAMQKYGLAWSERYNEYVIPDAICIDKGKLEQYLALIENMLEKFNRGENIVSEEEQTREQHQSYYTQECSVKYLQAFIHHHLNNSSSPLILDPAAGTGNLIDGLNVSKNSIWAIEPDTECCDILRKKGFVNVINTDFETAVANDLIPTPTHIIMNPPFSKQQDIKLYNLACRLLKENGGVISAIVSENSIYEELKQFGLILDCNHSKLQAIQILGGPYSDKLSNHMKEFLENIATSKWVSLDDVTSEFGFENTDARAFFVRHIVKEREKGKETYTSPNQDDGR